MKFLVYVHEETYKLGIVTDRGVIPAPLSVSQFYDGGLAALADIRQTSLDGLPALRESDLALAPVVPQPGKILCVGLNYRQHALESGMQIPEYPVLFSKFNNAIAAPNEDIPIQASWTQVDYESELVVVIGKTARNVETSAALSYVLGYCNGNDLSERALQFRTNQWLLGKTPDKFLPIGPYLVTADEIPNPQALPIRGWLNGELRQNSSTQDMIFTVAEIIAYCSQHMTLLPGDIICTGTPQGVILGLPEDRRVWMRAGDTYVVEIGPLGRLSNTVVVR